jgi:glycosyltransferase involved in cell wall biosynthesis
LDVAAFLRFTRSAENIRFIMVNDGSTDDTSSVLARLCAACPNRFASVELACNSGKAEAVRVGLQQALADHPAAVGFWDADLAAPLEALVGFRQLLASRGDIDIVVGSRIPLLGRRIRRNPTRAVLGRLFARTASGVLGLRFYDTQCGAKLFRASGELRAVLAAPFLARWIFDVELFARLAAVRGVPGVLRSAIYEMPLDDWREQPGSKLRTRHFALACVDLLRILWSYSGPRARAYAASLTPILTVDREEPHVPIRAA